MPAYNGIKEWYKVSGGNLPKPEFQYLYQNKVNYLRSLGYTVEWAPEYKPEEPEKPENNQLELF